MSRKTKQPTNQPFFSYPLLYVASLYFFTDKTLLYHWKPKWVIRNIRNNLYLYFKLVCRLYKRSAPSKHINRSFVLIQQSPNPWPNQVGYGWIKEYTSKQPYENTIRHLQYQINKKAWLEDCCSSYHYEILWGSCHSLHYGLAVWMTMFWPRKLYQHYSPWMRAL